MEPTTEGIQDSVSNLFRGRLSIRSEFNLFRSADHAITLFASDYSGSFGLSDKRNVNSWHFPGLNYK